MGKLLVLEPARLLEEPVVVGLASLENHGVLPLGSDALIADCVLSRVDGAYVAPLLAYTVSIEHAMMGYTVTAGQSVFLDYAVSVLRGLSMLTVRGVLAVSFHGGASRLLHEAARRVRVESGARIIVDDFWSIVASYLGERGVAAGLIHGGVVEASILAACGYRVGSREVGFEEALEALAAEARGKRVALTPWHGLDNLGIYDSTLPVYSSRLGSEIIEYGVRRLREHLESL